MKTIFLTLIISLFSSESNELISNENNVTAKFTYTSKKCTYDVYQATGGGTIGCNDWTFVGSVTSSRNVTITLNRGDNVVVRVLKNNAGVCEGGKIKRQDNLSLRSSATRSSSTSWELHDWEC